MVNFYHMVIVRAPPPLRITIWDNHTTYHTDNHATYHMVKNGFWKDPSYRVDV
jgi:hypothetical protein